MEYIEQCPFDATFATFEGENAEAFDSGLLTVYKRHGFRFMGLRFGLAIIGESHFLIVHEQDVPAFIEMLACVDTNQFPVSESYRFTSDAPVVHCANTITTPRGWTLNIRSTIEIRSPIRVDRRARSSGEKVALRGTIPFGSSFPCLQFAQAFPGAEFPPETVVAAYQSSEDRLVQIVTVHEYEVNGQCQSIRTSTRMRISRDGNNNQEEAR